MVGDEYSSSTGGALKLKGAKNAGIEKKRKKDKKKLKQSGEQSEAKQSDQAEARDGDADLKRQGDAAESLDTDEREHDPDSGKTEAQRRHEEMRKRRLDERLKREGVKTHKERVEELNKYLSTLSEHHDMPRIGPG